LAQSGFARSIASKPFIQMIFIMGEAARTGLRSKTSRESNIFTRPVALREGVAVAQ